MSRIEAKIWRAVKSDAFAHLPRGARWALADLAVRTHKSAGFLELPKEAVARDSLNAIMGHGDDFAALFEPVGERPAACSFAESAARLLVVIDCWRDLVGDTVTTPKPHTEPEAPKVKRGMTNTERSQKRRERQRLEAQAQATAPVGPATLREVAVAPVNETMLATDTATAVAHADATAVHGPLHQPLHVHTEPVAPPVASPPPTPLHSVKQADSPRCTEPLHTHPEAVAYPVAPSPSRPSDPDRISYISKKDPDPEKQKDSLKSKTSAGARPATVHATATEPVATSVKLTELLIRRLMRAGFCDDAHETIDAFAACLLKDAEAAGFDPLTVLSAALKTIEVKQITPRDKPNKMLRGIFKSTLRLFKEHPQAIETTSAWSDESELAEADKTLAQFEAAEAERLRTPIVKTTATDINRLLGAIGRPPSFTRQSKAG